MILFSRAKLAYLNQRPARAIALYREILTQQPYFSAVQLELARSYRADRQLGQALALFRQLSTQLPETSPYHAEIRRTIRELTRATGWSFTLSGGSHYTDNYYQTPVPRAHCLAYGTEGHCTISAASQPPVPVLQWRSDADLYRLTPLAGSHFLTQHYLAAIRHATAGDIPGSVTLTAKAGYHYQDRHTLWQLTPATEQQFTGGTRYSAWYGVHTRLHHQLAPQWSAGMKAALQQHHYHPRLTAHDGTQFQVIPQIIWQPDLRTSLYLQGEADIHRKQDPFKHHRVVAVHAGVTRWWHPLFLHTVHVAYRHKRYDHAHPLHRRTREDRTQQYSTTLSFYPPSFSRISPQLSLIHTRNHSSVPWLHTWRQTEIMLRFERQF